MAHRLHRQSLLFQAEILIVTDEPVSYTHLDVYKRQGLHKSFL